jgi:hypothetical protein
MRAAQALLILIGTSLLIGTSSPALASDGFNIVIPGRAGVPIIINGLDASYAVVEGDWGLARGTHVQPTVYGGRLINPEPNVGHYYPSAGNLPAYGRLEIEPPANRKLPKPAESYHQSWTSQSAPPAPPPEPVVPFYPPPIIGAPQDGGAGMPQDAPDSPQDFRRSKSRNLPN